MKTIAESYFAWIICADGMIRNERFRAFVLISFYFVGNGVNNEQTGKRFLQMTVEVCVCVCFNPAKSC